MDLIRISAVSYLNTMPFVLGIKTSGQLEDIELSIDVPSVCSAKLLSGEADIALVPVGAIPGLPDATIVSEYCIGAEREVKSVLLLSHMPLEKITDIYLDSDSMTSVRLIKILAGRSWKISPRWHDLDSGKPIKPSGIDSVVVIGDKTFALAPHFPYVYDLAAEWIAFTALPFVFAVWMTNTSLPEDFLAHFNQALKYGIQHREEVPEFFKDRIPPGVDVMKYYAENISFDLDKSKRKGMELFLDMLTG